jgi:hypothetical protein
VGCRVCVVSDGNVRERLDNFMVHSRLVVVCGGGGHREEGLGVQLRVCCRDVRQRKGGVVGEEIWG